ncbi:MAG: cysteine rich repeat-containing protein [Hyphomicrobiales bacterium]|nr:cysteine rich repeat-containing protein [Hyphomicrobiales bacterium]
MRSSLTIAGAMVASILIGSPTVAQTIGYGEAIRGLTAACGADIEKHCKGIKPGGGAISVCLARNSSAISNGCAATFEAAFALLSRRAAAQDAAPQICAADAKRLCSNFRQGGARILRCLIRRDNIRKVSNQCNQAITDAGWR